MGTVRVSQVFDPTTDLVLYEEDCLDLLAQIPDGSVQLVVASPPYNLGKPYEKRLHMDDYVNQQTKVIRE